MLPVMQFPPLVNFPFIDYLVTQLSVPSLFFWDLPDKTIKPKEQSSLGVGVPVADCCQLVESGRCNITSLNTFASVLFP